MPPADDPAAGQRPNVSSAPSAVAKPDADGPGSESSDAQVAVVGSQAVRPDPDLARLESVYLARLDSMLLDYHRADAEFMVGMIHHHAQALVMSAHASRNGASPSIGVLAARIINAQKDEIAVMRNWLLDRGLSVPDPLGHLWREAEEVKAEAQTGHKVVHRPSPPEPDVPAVATDDDSVAVGGHESTHHMMPGMLSPEQLEELADARGPEFDRLFLTYMIMHHEGAVSMVHDLFATDGAAQGDLVFKLASDIQVDQATEIARMRLMLGELDGGHRHPGPEVRQGPMPH